MPITPPPITTSEDGISLISRIPSLVNTWPQRGAGDGRHKGRTSGCNNQVRTLIDGIAYLYVMGIEKPRFAEHGLDLCSISSEIQCRPSAS